MNHRISDRAAHVQQSGIRRYSAICAAKGGVNLSQGVCDLSAPDEIKEAAKHAIDHDHATYTHLRGIAELRTAIARKMESFNGIPCDPEQEVTVCVGSAGAFACAAMSLLNPSEEAILFSPFYSYHKNLLELVGANVRFVEMNPPDWEFTAEQLEAAVTDKSRMIVVCTPGNPSGKVFNEQELKLVIDVANRHDLYIVTDEIYEYITYGKPHISAGRFPEARDRTITISGASKTYAVTGWRIGYAVGPAEIIDRIGVVSDQFYICAPAPLQHGILAGLGLADSYYEKMAADYLEKRDLLAETLRGIDLEPIVPEGSYYMLASFQPGRWSNDVAAVESLLDDVGVAAVPGSAFYANPDDGIHQIRFCYAKKMPELQEACRRLSSVAANI
jgi:aminotransferase